jgi:phosphoglycolate phosphatase-like HAD superfamily hydrolase
LILDLDGTLIDSRPVILECFGKAVEAVFPGRVFDGASVRLGPPVGRMFQIAFPEATESELGEMLRAFRRHYDREAPVKTAPYDGALKTLAHCRSRGIVLDIATNKPWRISSAILAHLKLDGYIRRIVASDSVQPPFASKVEMVRHLMESGRLKPAETWLVGDSVEDAAAAAECGLPFVWAAYGYGRLGRAERKSAFRTIRTLGGLTQLLP